MKKLIILWTVLLGSNYIFSQATPQGNKVFGIISYHKIAPGKTLDDAAAYQRKWKDNLHTGRKAAGLISDWGMYTYYPYGFVRPLKSDHDYFTVNFGFDLDKINDYPQKLVDLFLAKEPDLLQKYTDEIVRGEIYRLEADIGKANEQKFSLMEIIKVKPEHYFEYLEMEKKMAQFHEERAKMGIITRWTFWQRIAPTLHNGYHYFATVNEFNSLSKLQMDLGGYSDELARKIFNMSLPQAWNKMISLREIEDSMLFEVKDKL